MHRFRLVSKIQLNNLNFESYWLVDLKFRAPDWSKFKLFGQIYCRFGRNRNLCSALVETTVVCTYLYKHNRATSLRASKASKIVKESMSLNDSRDKRSNFERETKRWQFLRTLDTEITQ